MMYTQSAIESALTTLHLPNISIKERNRADHYLQSFQRSNKNNDNNNADDDDDDVAWNISMNLVLYNDVNKKNNNNTEIIKYFGAQCLYEIGVRNNGRYDNRDKEILTTDLWKLLIFSCDHDKHLVHVHKKLTITFIGLYAQQERIDGVVEGMNKYNILDVLNNLQSQHSSSTSTNSDIIMYASIMILSLYIEELYNPSLAVCKSKRYKLQEEANSISRKVIDKLNEYYHYYSNQNNNMNILLLFQAVKNWIQYSTTSLSLLLNCNHNQLFNVSDNVILQEAMNVLATTTYNNNNDINNDNNIYNESFELIHALIHKLEVTLSSLNEQNASIDGTNKSSSTDNIIITAWIVEGLLKLENWKVCKKVVILTCDMFQCTYHLSSTELLQLQLLNRIGDILQHTIKLSIAQLTFPCWILYFQNNNNNNNTTNYEHIRNHFFQIILHRTQFPIMQQQQQQDYQYCQLDENDVEEWEDFREEMRQCCRDIVNNNTRLCEFLTNELSNQLHQQLSISSSSSWNIIESYIHAYSGIARYIPLENNITISTFLTWLFTTVPKCEHYKHNIPIYKSISIFIGVLINWIITQDNNNNNHRLQLVIPILFHSLTFPDQSVSSMYSMKLKEDHVALVALYKIFRKNDHVKQHIQHDWKMQLLQIYKYNFQLILENNNNLLLEHSSHQLLLRTLLQVPNVDILQTLLHFLFHELLQSSNIVISLNNNDSNNNNSSNANSMIEFSILCLHWKVISECNYENIILKYIEINWSTTLQTLFQYYYSNNIGIEDNHHLQLLNEFIISLYMHHQNNGLAFIQITLPFFQNILHTSTTITTTLVLVLPILNAMTIALPLHNINDFHIIMQDILQKYYFVYYVNNNVDTSTTSEALVRFFEQMGQFNPTYIIHTNTIELIVHFIDACNDMPCKFELLQMLCKWYKHYPIATASTITIDSATALLSSHMHPFFMQHGPKWTSFILTIMRHAQFQHSSIDTFLIIYKTVNSCNNNNNDMIFLWIDKCFQQYPTFPRANTSVEEKLKFKNQLVVASGNERKIRRILKSFVGKC